MLGPQKKPLFKGIFAKFSAKKKQKKTLVLRISRYLIWDVRYEILFNILKSPIYQHSIISRYANLTPGSDHAIPTISYIDLGPWKVVWNTMVPVPQLRLGNPEPEYVKSCRSNDYSEG